MRDRYRELIATLPLPSEAQTESFAAYVVKAHSWYKLPPIPPAGQFACFLDPNAGRRIACAAGEFECRDEIEAPHNAHYAWMPTAEYRAKFGYWQYAYTLGQSWGEEMGVLPYGRVVGPDRRSLPVSPDVLEAGSVTLTAVVHEQFVAAWVPVQAEIARHMLATHSQGENGPYAPGYRWLIEMHERYKDDLPALDRLLAAARARERAALRAALQRARAVLSRPMSPD